MNNKYYVIQRLDNNKYLHLSRGFIEWSTDDWNMCLCFFREEDADAYIRSVALVKVRVVDRVTE